MGGTLKAWQASWADQDSSPAQLDSGSEPSKHLHWALSR